MVVAKPPIYFHFIVPPFYFPHRGLIKTFLLSIFKKHNKTVQALNYIFCSNKYLLSLNQKHLQHDYYTDIIAFELSEKGQPLMADIYISVEMARQNAQDFKVSTTNEVLRLMIHGTLHLCGYRDKKPKEKEEIKAKEDYYLHEYLFHVKQTCG